MAALVARLDSNDMTEAALAVAVAVHHVHHLAHAARGIVHQAPSLVVAVRIHRIAREAARPQDRREDAEKVGDFSA